MNDPPDHTAEFNAANLLSAAGITEQSIHGISLRFHVMHCQYL